VHHHHVTQSSHSINAIGPAPLCTVSALHVLEQVKLLQPQILHTLLRRSPAISNELLSSRPDECMLLLLLLLLLTLLHLAPAGLWCVFQTLLVMNSSAATHTIMHV
jgi:hypothetical protein